MIPHSTTSNIQKFFLQLRDRFFIKSKGFLLFFREIFSNPLAIGAACPSSKRLARAMAKQVPVGTLGTIVELGPGTGVVTQVLLDHGIRPEKLVVIEKADAFVRHLIDRFPQLSVIKGDAKNVKDLLASHTNIRVVVSSLPLRSLPANIVESILTAIDEILPDGGLFIQFTYYYGATGVSFPKTFQRIHSEYVLLNFPPARVDVFYHTVRAATP